MPTEPIWEPSKGFLAASAHLFSGAAFTLFFSLLLRVWFPPVSAWWLALIVGALLAAAKELLDTPLEGDSYAGDARDFGWYMAGGVVGSLALAVLGVAGAV